MPVPWESDGFTAVKGGPSVQGPAQEPPTDAAPASTPMPWGKHKGTPIGQVPRSYMAWCLDNADALQSDIRRAFEFMTGAPIGTTQAKVDPNKPPWSKGSRENGRRDPPPRVTAPPPIAQIASLRGLVKSWYAKTARRFHPDMGGDAKQMMVVTHCYKTLCEEIDRWESQK
jgi:uncharacterized protein (DUF3820 family)